MGMLRKVMIETRNRLENREEKDRVISEFLYEMIGKENVRFFIYANCDSEVETIGMIHRLNLEGKEVYCPKMIGRDMEFFTVRSQADLEPGLHHIPEPVTDENSAAAYPGQEDIMIIPGVVFDANGGRMGYGSGVYDRYLAKYPCRKIALAYEAQVMPIPLDLKDKDIRMDVLITEEKVRVFGETE